MSFEESRRLVTALRHDGSLLMNSHGWVKISDLQQKPDFRHFDGQYIRFLADSMKKSRLEISTDGLSVRATSGHSVHISVETLLTPIERASDVTYCAHGTRRDVLPNILQYGLYRMDRHYIHFAGHPNAVRCHSEVVIHLDVEKYLRRNPGTLYWTKNNTIVAMGNRFGYIRPSFFRYVEYL